MKPDTNIGDELEHKQAPVKYENEVIFTVDEKPQSLIQFFVDKGIEIFNSCEDNTNGNAWIEFGLEDWITINHLAFLSESRELMEFIQEECGVLLLSTDDGHPDENDEYWIEGENLIWSASVRFPKEHLEDFEQMVRFTLDHVGEEGADSIQ